MLVGLCEKNHNFNLPEFLGVISFASAREIPGRLRMENREKVVFMLSRFERATSLLRLE